MRLTPLFLAFEVLINVVSQTHGLAAVSMKFIGVDLGTSGARLSVIENDDDDYKEVYAQAIQWDNDDASYDDPKAWSNAVDELLEGAANSVSMDSVQSICISGTSASCLLVNGESIKPTRSPRMYNYNVDNKVALEALERFAPPRHTARSPTGSLAKLLAWNAEQAVTETERLCHQSDYVTQLFMDEAAATNAITSDWHNCLKLGYDVRFLEWPAWMMELFQSVDLSPDVLPAHVVSPGEPIGRVRPDIAKRFGLPETTVMVGGTTDSNAAFFAATGGSANMGTAVTSLGSTLAIKQLSAAYVEDADKGVYSHRFPSSFAKGNKESTADEAWLVGGASNVGCGVLRSLDFSNDELVELSKHIDPSTDSPLSYYPLTSKGERFPVADSNKEPCLEPIPDDRSKFLHGILQGISDVERDGFLALRELGAVPPTPIQVFTCGGGSRNDMWTEMRQRRLRDAFAKICSSKSPVIVTRANNVEASYGAAILAAASFTKS